MRAVAHTDNLVHHGGLGVFAWADVVICGVDNREARLFINSACARTGKTWVDGNSTRARWVDIHGRIDGKETGMSVMCHPENFRAPQPVRLHPHKPYFCFAPMILGEFSIEPETIFTSRYRLFVHAGGPDATMSDRLWNDYANPPTVEIIADK